MDELGAPLSSATVTHTGNRIGIEGLDVLRSSFVRTQFWHDVSSSSFPVRTTMDIASFMEKYTRARETKDEDLLASLLSGKRPIEIPLSPSNGDMKRSRLTGNGPSYRGIFI